MRAGCLYELTDSQLMQGGPALDKARLAFDVLKSQYVSMPVLRHANFAEPFHILLYSTAWAVSATVAQLHDVSCILFAFAAVF